MLFLHAFVGDKRNERGPRRLSRRLLNLLEMF